MLSDASSKLLAVSAMLLAGGFRVSLSAQQASSFAGDYVGRSGPLTVNLHLLINNGTLSGTIDSPNQGLTGLPCSEVHTNGQSLTFKVPSVRGTWMGFLSADGTTLSGTWNQGQSQILNFTRSETKGSSTPSQSQNPEPTPLAPPSPSAQSGCPPGSMGNYWDGSSWKPLKNAVVLGKGRGISLKDTIRNPFAPNAGDTNIIAFRGPAADLTLTSTPRFCFPSSLLGPNATMQYTIGKLQTYKNDREMESGAYDKQSKAGRMIPAKRAIDTSVKDISASYVEVTPKQPLSRGQYIISTTLGVFDFGVQ